MINNMSNILKDGFISATYRFHQALKGLNLSKTEIDRLLREFIKYFSQSEDYDLAEAHVFDRLMSSLSKNQKDKFKTYWKTRFEKIRMYKRHITELKSSDYSQIRDELRKLVLDKYDADPEEAAKEICEKYDLYWMEVYHLAWNFANHPIYGKKLKKGWFSEGNNLLSVQSLIRNLYLQGTSETEIVRSSVEVASKQLGRVLNAEEIDKLRWVVLSEKIKLEEKRQI